MANNVIQVHHIIPRDIYNKFIDQGIIELLGDLQWEDNLIMLFTAEEDARKMQALNRNGALGDFALGASRHNFNHKAYSKVVGDRVDRIINSSFADEDKTKMLVDLQTQLRHMAMQGEPSLYSDVDSIENYLKRHQVLTPDNFHTVSHARADAALSARLETIYDPVDLVDGKYPPSKLVGDDNDKVDYSSNFAKAMGAKVRNAMLQLNAVEPFFLANTRGYFENGGAWDSSQARSGIYKMVYDLSAFESQASNNPQALAKQKATASNPMVKKAAQERLAYIRLFQKTREQLLSGKDNGQALLKQLKQRQADANAYKLLIDLNTQGGKADVGLVLRGYGEGGRKLKGSALMAVLDEVFRNNQYNKQQINGVDIGTLKLLAGTNSNLFKANIVASGIGRYWTDFIEVDKLSKDMVHGLLGNLRDSGALGQNADIASLDLREARGLLRDNLHALDINAMPEKILQELRGNIRISDGALAQEIKAFHAQFSDVFGSDGKWWQDVDWGKMGRRGGTAMRRLCHLCLDIFKRRCTYQQQVVFVG